MLKEYIHQYGSSEREKFPLRQTATSWPETRFLMFQEHLQFSFSLRNELSAENFLVVIGQLFYFYLASDQQKFQNDDNDELNFNR